MAGDRLEHWFTLPREELQRRVDQISLKINLPFKEQQLLTAARDRLLSWKEPRKLKGKPKMSENDTTTPTLDDPAPEKQKETKVAKKSKKAAAPKKSNKPAKAVKAKAAKGNGAVRIPAEAKVTKTNKENPFREGSGSHKRVELVLKNSGKTAGTIMKLAGVKPTTLATCKRLGLVKIEA